MLENAAPVLLADGKEAFPKIIECIDRAESRIYINMFIWRRDEIGREIARHLLAAADRGVKIRIVKDRYGIMLEYCEENQESFFCSHPTLWEILQIRTMELLYNTDLFGKEKPGVTDPLAEQLRTHPNAVVIDDVKRCDHSKFYVFDDRCLIFGGINVEDKENGRDRCGRIYRDFMIMTEDPQTVRAFLADHSGRFSPRAGGFSMNLKEPARRFEMKEEYLRLIRNAEKHLRIIMPYFCPDRTVARAVMDAMDRGVKVELLIPAQANFMSDANRRAVRRLYEYGKKTGADITVYLSPCMVHAKLVMNEAEASLGSANINRRAFEQLDELNYTAAMDDSPFACAIRQASERILSESEPSARAEELSSRGIYCFMESLFM